MAALCAGEWVGGSGLWEDGGPADHDRTGPSVPEPLPVIWLYLESPCALKLPPSLHKQRYYTRPTAETSTESRKRQSSEEFFPPFEAEMHCQGPPHEAIGIVLNIPRGHEPSSFSFMVLACTFLYKHMTC